LAGKIYNKMIESLKTSEPIILLDTTTING